jgi:hypothetical protein
MQSVWVKWNISRLRHWELTPNDVVGGISKAFGEYSCEAREEKHGGGKYVVRTKQGPYILCRMCREKLGLAFRR